MSSQDKPLQIKLNKLSITKLIDNLKLTKEKAKEYAVQAVAMALNEVERVAKNVVPLKTGELMRSIHAENPIEKSDRIIGSVSADKEYAYVVHEGITKKGKRMKFLIDRETGMVPRKAKYLYGPLKEIGFETLKKHMAGIIGYLAKYVKGGKTI